jgi:hypothetical protein
MTHDDVLAYRLISFVYLDRTVHDPEPSTLLAPFVKVTLKSDPCSKAMARHVNNYLSKLILACLRGRQSFYCRTDNLAWERG